jgi:hypothetical protein
VEDVKTGRHKDMISSHALMSSRLHVVAFSPFVAE